MRKEVSGCVECGISPCKSCENIIISICDICDDEVDELREFDGEEICKDCYDDKWFELEVK